MALRTHGSHAVSEHLGRGRDQRALGCQRSSTKMPNPSGTGTDRWASSRKCQPASGPLTTSAVTRGLFDENQSANLAGLDRQTARHGTSDTQLPAPHRCAQPKPPDSCFCSYSTPPTTNDHPRRNSWQPSVSSLKTSHVETSHTSSCTAALGRASPS